jgi:hypothetical protein
MEAPLFSPKDAGEVTNSFQLINCSISNVQSKHERAAADSSRRTVPYQFKNICFR